MKKRILMVGESSHLKSGFGNYTREILSRLYNTNKYEIAELSCYRTPDVPKIEPWKVYPVAVRSSDPLFSEYNANSHNQYGQWRFEFALLDFKPHIVFDIRDFWNYIFQEISPLRSYYHWVITPTYDSAPQKIDSINTLKNADMVLFHTHWAKSNLLDKYNYNVNNLGPIANDAVNSSVFRPVGYSKRFHKIKYGINQDSFVIGSVMRNQKRKLIPDLLKIFSKLLIQNPNILLYLHTSYPDGMGWDIPSLLLENNISNNVLFTYKCSSCNHYCCSVYKGIRKICPNCNKKECRIWSVSNSIPDTELNNIYNLFDVYIQYAICEGFGIPVVEAASAGIPVVTVDYDAMGEVGSSIGAKLINTKAIFREQETNANRCYPDNDQCYDVLQKLINTPLSELNSVGKDTRNKLLKNYSWDKTAKIYEEIFDNIDVNQKRSWDDKINHVNLTHQVINHQENRDFIYDIVDNIIKEPTLKRTAFIEDIIKSLDETIVVTGNGLQANSFKRSDAIKLLEAYANNKNAMEIIRTQKIETPPKLQKFIEYSNK